MIINNENICNERQCNFVAFLSSYDALLFTRESNKCILFIEFVYSVIALIWNFAKSTIQVIFNYPFYKQIYEAKLYLKQKVNIDLASSFKNEHHAYNKLKQKVQCSVHRGGKLCLCQKQFQYGCTNDMTMKDIPHEFWFFSRL